MCNGKELAGIRGQPSLDSNFASIIYGLCDPGRAA